MEHFSVGQLKAMPFFHNLSTELIQLLLERGRLTAEPKKKLLFSRQEPAGTVLLLLSGQAAVYNITKHGNRKILFFLGKGHLLNHDIQSQRPASIYCEAIMDIQLLQIEKAEFLKLMKKHFSLTQAVLSEYECYLWRLSHQLKNTSGSMQTERKIAAKLWKLGRDFGEKQEDGIHINLPFTMTLMADFAGIPRENVSRACKSLSMRGLLKYQNRRFILPNPQGLAEFYKM